MQTKPLPIQTRAKTSHRDNEIVQGGFDSYFRIAMAMLLRWYNFAFDNHAEKEQTAALAALIALNQLGPDCTLAQVTRAVKQVIYQQTKAQGWYLHHYRKPNGQESTRWIRPEHSYSGDGSADQHLQRLLA